MNAELVSELEVPVRRSIRARVVRTLGPLTVAGGLVWALLQPYRVTLLHPHGESFWWLAVEPPLTHSVLPSLEVGVSFGRAMSPKT